MTAIAAGERVRPRASRDHWAMAAALVLIAALLVIFVALPLYTLLSKSFENADGGFVGLANFSKFLTTPALSISISNSLQIALAASFITTSLAFVYAYAITRSQMPLRALFKGLALLPLLAPSLLPGISLVYLFGNKGLVKEWLMGESMPTEDKLVVLAEMCEVSPYWLRYGEHPQPIKSIETDHLDFNNPQQC